MPQGSPCRLSCRDRGTPSSPRALPNEPKLGPPGSSSSRDNQSPNMYSIWLKPDISGTISPRLPVFGFPVEGATSPTSQADFRWVVFVTTETVCNQRDHAEGVGGRLAKKVPPLYGPWIRSYGLWKFRQDGRQLSNLFFD
ncbi:hypothetical protein ACJJTC_005233 [Scirpophaga incertulas]